MKDGNSGVERSPSAETVRHFQLMALIRDLIEGNGRVKAAKMLRVSRRTLTLAADTGRLTVRMVDALERHLLRDVSSPASEWNERAAESVANRGPSPGTYTIQTANLPRAVQSKTVVLDPEHDYGQQYGLASPLVEE